MRFSIIALFFLSAVGSASAYSYTVEGIEELISRARGSDTKHCANNAPIGKDKDKYSPKCQRSNSLGYKSAHNCKGKSYLCVQSGIATCYSIGDAKKRSFENGECFN